MNQTYTYTGYVHHIGQTRTFASGFAIRTLVLEADPNAKYRDFAVFDFTKTQRHDGTHDLDLISVGSRVTVTFRLSANESQKNPGSWYGSCRAESVVSAEGRTPDLPMSCAKATIPTAATPTTSASSDTPEVDDLPF